MTDRNGRVGQQYSGELRLTHDVLDSRLSPLAKLTLAAVEYFQPYSVTLKKLERLLPARRRAIPGAIKTAETGEWVTVERPTRRERGTARFESPNVYTLAFEASPNLVAYTRLRLRDLDTSAARWILRAVYEREQAKRGAVCLPDALAAATAGMTRKAVRLAREDWRQRGLVTVLEPGRRGRPAILTLNGSPYRARLSEFDPDLYALRRFTLADESFETWATADQLLVLESVIRRNEDADVATAYAEHFGHDGGIVTIGHIFNALVTRDGLRHLDTYTLGVASKMLTETCSLASIPT